jgi:hypothetical protein
MVRALAGDSTITKEVDWGDAALRGMTDPTS